MDHSIYRYILRHSKYQQIFILLITLASFPFLYYSLDLPKQIINDAIGGTGFPKDLFFLSLDQVPYLIALSLIFLSLVLINGAFKYYINVYKGLLGERMLRRLRYELYVRVLRFPPHQFKRTSQGEIIPMITAEVEPMGGFIGDAFALPVFQGGTLLVYIFFIFNQDLILGAAAISLYPIQGYLIPRLQKRVNQLGKQRVRAVRALSDRIGESVSGISEMHAHDTTQLFRAQFSRRLGDIFTIRFEIYRRKFFIKFLNNFLNQLTPFFFYSIGGYLVIEGSITFGALVAVLAAYKDLAGPWKELLTYYQQKEDIRIKYEQVVEQFQPPDILPVSRIDSDQALTGPFPETLRLVNVSFGEEDSPPAVDGVTLDIDTRRHVAIIGGNGDGKEELAQLVARLIAPTGGSIQLGETDYADLPEAVTGRRIGYVGPSGYIFTGTLRENLHLGLKHRPKAPHVYPEPVRAHERWRLHEAEASGGSLFDVNDDWVDYAEAGCTSPQELEARTIALLEQVELADDTYRMGLSGTMEGAGLDVGEALMQARVVVQQRLEEDPDIARQIEIFDPELYNDSATLAENLLFGTPVGPTFVTEALATNEYVRRILDEAGLTADLEASGRKVAETMVELFAGLPPGHEFFEQFSFVSAEELADFPPLLARAEKEGMEALPAADRARFLTLPFKLIPSRHRLGVIDDALRGRILAARRLFRERLPEELAAAIEFFDATRFSRTMTLQDNILFGKVRYGQSGVHERVQALIASVVDSLDLRHTVMAVGLDRSVGIAGARLTTAQKQKVALSRALIRRPDLLVLCDATVALDGAAQVRILDNVRTLQQGRGLIWALHRTALARRFDELVVMKNGRVADHGPYETLAETSEALQALAAND